MPVVDALFVNANVNANPYADVRLLLHESPVLGTIFDTFNQMVNDPRPIYGVVDHLLDPELANELAIQQHALWDNQGKLEITLKPLNLG